MLHPLQNTVIHSKKNGIMRTKVRVRKKKPEKQTNKKNKINLIEIAKMELKENSVILTIGMTAAHKDHECGFKLPHCNCKISQGKIIEERK
jgi:hypothetical protein